MQERKEACKEKEKEQSFEGRKEGEQERRERSSLQACLGSLGKKLCPGLEAAVWI